MTLGDGIRRNVAMISQEERDRLRDAFLQLDTTKFYPDGVSYWDKQEVKLTRKDGDSKVGY